MSSRRDLSRSVAPCRTGSALGRAAGALLGVAALLWTVPVARAGSGRFDASRGAWDIVVSLSWEATESDLARIKLRFTQASALLHDVTDGAMRFGKVTLFDGGAGRVFADVIIQQRQGAASATMPGAGIVGGVIHLFTDDDIEPATGQPEDDTWQTIVHEFGHYGLYLADEYEGTAEPECVLPAQDGRGHPLPTAACIMDDYKVIPYQDVTELCDAINHDPDHDTEQDARFGHSCWERVDLAFPTIAAPSTVTDATPSGLAAPVFEYFDEPRLRVALVLDTSSSMNLAGGLTLGVSRLEDLRAHASGFIDDMEEDSAEVELGIVTFASTATQAQAATLLAGAADVATAKANLPSVATGHTNIGAGLASGRDLLTASTALGPLVMILITDGFHNYPVGDASFEPLAVLPSVVAEGIRVHTLALGDSTNEAELRAIADASGSMFWKANNTKMLEPSLRMIAAVVRGGSMLLPARQHELKAGEIHVAEGWKERSVRGTARSLLVAAGERPRRPEPGLQEILAPIWIEAGCEEVGFHLAWSSAAAAPSLVVASPAGALIGPGATLSAVPGVTRGSGSRYVSYYVESPQSGWWNPAVVADTRAAVDTFYSFVPTAISPTVVGYADGETLEAREDGASIRILGTVRDALPVTGASATAIMTSPRGVAARVELHDDGRAGGDVAAHDGLYSATVRGLVDPGTYTFDVVFDVDPSAPSPPTVIPGEEPQPTVLNSRLYSVQKLRRSFPVAIEVEPRGAPPDDRDRDGLPDRREGSEDADRDGIPNDQDPDADGDELPDLDEGGGDLDCDGMPNFLDRDSDGDGLDDHEDPTPLASTSCEPTLPAWFSLYSSRGLPARFVAISEDGAALYVEASGRNFETSSVTRVARGRLGSATLDDLGAAMRALHQLGSDAIAAMRPIERIEERGLLADIASRELDATEWSGLPLRALPADVAEVLERAATAASDLPAHRPVSLVQARPVDARRAEQIRSDPRGFYSFVPVDEDLSRSLPMIATALRDPGRIVELSEDEDSRLRQWRARSNPRDLGSSVFVVVEREALSGYYQLHYRDRR